ncbi:hypothetical protein EI94DRAFT_1698110, partial [Lactarius quietus]
WESGPRGVTGSSGSEALSQNKNSIQQYKHAAERLYKPKGFMHEDIIDCVAPFGVLPALVISPSTPTVAEVDSNILSCCSSFNSVSGACSGGNAPDSDLWQPLDKTQIMHQVLMLDELAVEKCVHLDDLHNNFQGTCRNGGRYCEAKRGDALVILAMTCELSADSLIYALLQPLKFLNLLVGPDDITADKDFKHIIKCQWNIFMQSYLDINLMVKNAFFCVVKMKIDNPGTNFYLLGSRASGLTEVIPILAEHPEWDYGTCHLSLPVFSKETLEFTSKADHISPKDWRSNLSVSNVNLHTCWLLGQKKAEELIPDAEAILRELMVNQHNDNSDKTKEVNEEGSEDNEGEGPTTLDGKLHQPFLHRSPEACSAAAMF